MKRWLVPLFVFGIVSPVLADNSNLSEDDTGNTIVSFRWVRDCPRYLEIDPQYKKVFDENLAALRKRPLAGAFKNENGEDDLTGPTAEKISDKECRKVAVKVAAIPKGKAFMIVRKDARAKLGLSQ